MFATGPAKPLECLSQVLAGSTLPLTHEHSQAGESSTIFSSR